jgi:hypothetical protein
MPSLAAGQAVLPPPRGAACLRATLPHSPRLALSRPAQRTLRQTRAAAGGQDPQQGEEKREFPAAAANARRQQIQQERSAIWGRIGDLVQGDSEEDDSVRRHTFPAASRCCPQPPARCCHACDPLAASPAPLSACPGWPPLPRFRAGCATAAAACFLLSKRPHSFFLPTDPD